MVGCGSVEVIQALPDAPAPASDAVVDAGCDPTPRRIEGVIVDDRMGTCCGGVAQALVDGRGLSGETHDCAGEHAWIGAQGSGEMALDLGAVYALSEVRIWNHGALAGGRGVDGIEILRSSDGRTLQPLPGAPRVLTRATSCPLLPQSFGVGGAPARFLHLAINGAHDPTTTPGLAEIEIIGARVCPAP